MSKPNEEQDIYYIPPNFLTGGRLFGGMIRARNAIEACVLVLLTGIPIIKLPLSLTARIIILCLIPSAWDFRCHRIRGRFPFRIRNKLDPLAYPPADPLPIRYHRTCRFSKTVETDAKAGISGSARAAGHPNQNAS